MKSKHILSFFMALAIALGLLPGLVLTAFAEEVAFTDSTKTLHGGRTYTVSGSFTTGRLECAKNSEAASVTLHLNDGCTLNTDGILCNLGVTLTIEGEGTLLVNQTNQEAEGHNGINVTDGSIIINGGNITTKGRGINPGIGGDRATIQINGGTVNATGGSNSAGIGGGHLDGNNDYPFTSITITGGTVTAVRGTAAAVRSPSPAAR